jgi:hypothetical protein
MSSVATVIKRTLENFRIRRGKQYKSVIRQVWENIMLILRVQLEPHEYYLFRLYPKKAKKEEVIRYLNSAQYTRDISPVLNPAQWHFILNDKLFSHLHFKKVGLPVAHQYGFYSPGFGFLNTGGRLSSREDFHDFILNEKPGSIVLKPHNTFGGYGIRVFQHVEYHDGVRFRSSNGDTVGLEDLSREMDGILTSGASVQGFVVESAIEQHPVIREIYPHSVNTLRIITYLTKDDQPRILGSRLRMGRHGNLVDNISQGGIHASVDQETGRIVYGLAITSREESLIAEHPDTGTSFVGVEIPFWDRILDLCRKAAKGTPLQRFIGWDIAIAKEGPVLIEGNSTGVEVAYDQINGQGFITETFRRDMLEYGIRFPERMPGISLDKIYRSYKISRRMSKISHT